MEADEARALLSPEGMRLLAGIDASGELDDVVGAVSRLRSAGHSPETVAAVLTQARLRRRARTKFGEFADRMLFTPDGLEQATRLRVAAIHARRFRDAGRTRVADLGCGIGGDALALAALDLEVLAVDRDEPTAAIAAYNLAPFPSARVEVGEAESTPLDGVDAAWLDPARRGGGRRRPDPADWSPALGFCWELGARMAIGVKLGPAIPHDLLPPDAEAQWVSEGRETVEAVVWTRELARPGIRRSALVLGAGGAAGSHSAGGESDGHSAGGAAELTAEGPAEDAPVGPLGAWLYEPDGAVIRARLIGEVARAVEGRMLDGSIAWIASDARVDTPFAARFRVEEEFPLDEKRLKRELAARGIGVLEIKKRGVDVDPARMRERLALRGEGEATLVLTRRAGRRIAILARRD